MECVTFNAAEVRRFNDSKEIVPEPSNAIWWPRKSNHEAVDFYRQPNELCQVTVNVDHDKLNMATILKEFEVIPGTLWHGSSLFSEEDLNCLYFLATRKTYLHLDGISSVLQITIS